MPPSSPRRVLTLASAKPALISLASFSMTWGGVCLGTPMVVGRRAHDHLGANVAAGAGPVLDDEGLA